MIVSTQAIVLNFKKYSDSSIIVDCVTENLGRQSVLVYGIGGRKSNKLSQFQPLFLLDLQIYNKPTRSLQKLKESKINPPLYNISSNHIKSTIALFLAEIISKCITEASSDKNLFNFLKTAILIFEELDTSIEIFHHILLLKLAKLLGILPELHLHGEFIDLTNGNLTAIKPNHTNFINKNQMLFWQELEQQNFERLSVSKNILKNKSEILDSIVKLYEIHILNFNSLKSYQVLKEVYS